ncbi:hypothetical protein [Bradyrhizobium elkanii]
MNQRIAELAAPLASHKPEAREAIDLFTFRVAAEVAVMANILAGLDGLVFTGGIGEHAADIRQRVCDRLSRLGVSIDTAANVQGEQRIAAKGSPVDVLVIPTNEEVSIARHCRSLLRTGR